MKLLRSRPFQVGALLWLGVAVPMLVALVKLSGTTWYPLIDMAQTDMRVRAVGSAHPPLIGLPGRIGPVGDIGSHPGPLSFWLLWPFTKLFGSSGWSLFAATFCLHLLAVAAVLWLARRRGGVALMVGVGVAVVVLSASYGTFTLMQPWNPFLPLLAWLVVLLGVWSVLLDDLRVTPLLVFAACFCMQTHLPYLGLGGGLLAFTAVVVLVRLVRRRADADYRRGTLVAAGIGLVLAAVLWLPPAIDQLVHTPGNLRLIYDDLAHPTQKAGGVRQGVNLLLVHLNPYTVVARHVGTTQSWATVVPGAVWLVVWLGAALLALRWRHRELLALHVTLAVATALGFVSMAKIYGPLYYYLMLWAWGTCALQVVAVGWTAAEWWRRRAPADADAPVRGARPAYAALAVVALVYSAVFSVDSARVEVPTPQFNRALAAVAPPTVAALRRGGFEGDKGTGRFLVTWTDPLALGSQGWGLLDAIDRAGLPIGVIQAFRGAVPPEQLVVPSKARALVHLSVGDRDIAAWRKLPGMHQVAYVDARTPAQRARYRQLRDRVVADLTAAHLSPNLIRAVDDNVVFVGLQEQVPVADQKMLQQMVDLGLPVAVFVGPGTVLRD